jgi:SAM-dependent methyltransferase
VTGDNYYSDKRVAERYDAEIGEDFQGDRDFYVGLAREAASAGHDVLELGAGTGRIAIPIAREGIRIVGLDRSPAMLEVARRKCAGLENITLVEGDMASFDLARSFGLIIIPARSFLLLMTVEEQKSCLRCIREHLVPGGRLALNFFNPDIAMMATWMGNSRSRLRLDRDSTLPEGGRKLDWETREYLTSTQQIDEARIEERLNDDGAVISRVYRKIGLRYVFRYEMQHLLEVSGFEIEALYGGFHGEPFGETSTEMVWVARRPDRQRMRSGQADMRRPGGQRTTNG